MNSDNRLVYVLFRDTVLIGVFSSREKAEEQKYPDREYFIVERWIDSSIEQ